MVNQNILILRPKFNIFWAIFIRLFLTFNTSDDSHIFVMVCVVAEYKNEYKNVFSRWDWESTTQNEEHLNDTIESFKNYLDGKHSYGESLQENFRKTSFRY
jgi:hypothetical protein